MDDDAGEENQGSVVGGSAMHLSSERYFVVETGVPDLRGLPPGEALLSIRRGPHHQRSRSDTGVGQPLVRHAA